MKKITLKIIISVFIVFFISTVIPRTIIRFTGDFPDQELIISDIFFIGMLLSVGLALVLFMLIINHLIVRRIKALNVATEKVIQGDFEVFIQDRGDDEISRLSQHFNVMIKELKANEYLNKSFVRNVSHEIKTPIAAIKGYADLLVHEELSKEEVTEYASIISETAQSMSTLSYNMLQISKLDSSDIVHDNQTFNLAEQIRNVIQLMQLQWEDKKLEIVLNLEEITIKSDKELLYQVWKNIFENAIKYTPDSGKIEWLLKENHDDVEAKLTNYGVGVKPEDLNHLCDLFYVPEDESKHGYGIGLSIVKRIISKLKGKILFESQQGEYFSVILKINKNKN
jgi:signal transduction histidine kinase